MKSIIVKISQDELKQSLLSRAAYHRKRAEEKRHELPKVVEAMETLQPQKKASPIKSQAYNADADSFVESLENDIRIHESKAIRFEFVANHLVDETYELTVNELEQFELIPTAY